MLSDPKKREMYDLGADPFAAAGGAGASGFGGAGFPFSDIMDAFFGTATSRGPRSRARRGRNATLRVELDLAETAFGTTRELSIDTAVACATCEGRAARPARTRRRATPATGAARCSRSSARSSARS